MLPILTAALTGFSKLFFFKDVTMGREGRHDGESPGKVRKGAFVVEVIKMYCMNLPV